MDIREVRVANLRELLAEEGNRQVALARRIGKSPSQLNQWFSGVRTITEESARAIEKAASKPTGWLDQNHGITSSIVALGRPRIQLSEALEALGEVLRDVAPDRREAVAGLFSSWVREGGAAIYPQLIAPLLATPVHDADTQAQPDKRAA